MPFIAVNGLLILIPSAIFLALYMGNDIAQQSNDLDLKVDRLVVHMIAGLTISVLFINRLIVSLTSNTTPQLLKENKRFEKAAVICHQLVYLLVFGVVLSGIGIAIQIDIVNILKAGETMPEKLSNMCTSGDY